LARIAGSARLVVNRVRSVPGFIEDISCDVVKASRAAGTMADVKCNGSTAAETARDRG
jgi:hypothetical protein